ncbi:MAG: hypothetical protein HWN66_02965 [Candidatus Helarchaeota archaeon]|nr:hypothetical protein [Candidatus Helarchaeota archaeon]
MSSCSDCGTEVEGDHNLCPACFQKLVNSKIKVLKPSTMKGMKCEDIFDGFMIYNMPAFLKKDIDEAIKCMSYDLPNATVLIATRILEIQLKEHVTIDLDHEEEPQNIWNCIEVLMTHAFSGSKYPVEFLEQLQQLKGVRNDAMHGKKRFESQEAVVILQQVFTIVAWLYNLTGEAKSFDYFI